jgi:hypothetical protein
LKILSGNDIPMELCNNDVNGDHQIGIAEAVFGLEFVSGYFVFIPCFNQRVIP